MKLDLKHFVAKHKKMLRMALMSHRTIDATASQNSASRAMSDLFGDHSRNQTLAPLKAQLNVIQENSSNVTHFLAVLQASRYRKTQLMLNLAKEHRVVDLLCSDTLGRWKT